jgi:hypothetical protein
MQLKAVLIGGFFPAGADVQNDAFAIQYAPDRLYRLQYSINIIPVY